jgi:selenocysteine lyase/cysteine desulfurase
MPKPAIKRMMEFQTEIASGGTTDFDEEAETRVFEDLRNEAAHLLSAKEHEIAIISGASEGICNVAWSLKLSPGSNIVSTDAEFPSVVYPWMRVAEKQSLDLRLARNRDGLIDETELEKLVDDRTAVVSISHVEYGTGQMFDLRWLAELAHSHGAILVVDASQSAGIVPVDVHRDSIDVLVTTSYKGLLGPFGAGILFVNQELCRDLKPIYAGWRSTPIPYDLDATQLRFAEAARKFEFGTMSYSSVVGLAESMKYIRELGHDDVSRSIMSVTQEFISSLRNNQSLPSHSLVTSGDKGHHASIVSVRFKQLDNAAIAKNLVEHNIIVSHRFNGVRFSFEIYNTKQDIVKAIEAIREVGGAK